MNWLSLFVLYWCLSSIIVGRIVSANWHRMTAEMIQEDPALNGDFPEWLQWASYCLVVAAGPIVLLTFAFWFVVALFTNVDEGV